MSYRRMSELLWLSAAILIVVSLPHAIIAEENGEQVLSLNGPWKFRTIFGEGGSPRDIQVQIDQTTTVTLPAFDKAAKKRVTLKAGEEEKVEMGW